ncbi:MAG: anti-sigma factor family protein [bacterium]
MGSYALTCDDVFARLDDFLDRQLSAAEMDAVRIHLERCAECANEYAFEGRVLEDLRAKLRRVRVPERLSEAITNRLTKEIPDERS